MKHQVNSKLLILFGIICGTFLVAESGFCAESIPNKSSTFSALLSKSDNSTSDSESALSAKIRAQRAAIDKHDQMNTISQKQTSGKTSNGCDNTLRKCIESKCGTDYTKCATDSDTTFSDKLNSCRKSTSCSAHEFTLFANEIKEDKKQEIRLSLYNQVQDCGNSYKNCIITQCGPKFDNCLGKSAGDKAIAACKNIATECTEADSGMAGRMGSIFSTVRQAAEEQVKKDEQKLYSLRDKMRDMCALSNGLLDDRSLQCVFTVNFFSGDDQSYPTASKKLFSGRLFDCTPDWFGIDITTFKENAYRITREQKAASAAMMGALGGAAAGAFASGAVKRSADVQRAKGALKDACTESDMAFDKETGKCRDLTPQENCEGTDGNWKGNSCECSEDKGLKQDGNNKCRKLTTQEACEKGGEWTGSDCNCGAGRKTDDDGFCVNAKGADACDKRGGKMRFGKCVCKKEWQTWNDDKTGCVDKPKAKEDCTGGNWQGDEYVCDGEHRLNRNCKCVRTVGTFVDNAIEKLKSKIGNNKDGDGEHTEDGNSDENADQGKGGNGGDAE